MQIHLIRNATLRVRYAGVSFVTDPYLAARHTRPSFTGASPNPLVNLPCSPEEVIEGIEMAIVSHLHSDHFDPAAQELLPKDTPLLCQPGDQERIESLGFHTVIPVADSLSWDGITISRIDCQHGSGEVLKQMGAASGFVFQAEGEPTLYWAGDTIWYGAVAAAIRQFNPQVILTHSCGAVWGDRVLIVMDAAQTVTVCQAAPDSAVVAIHMEALDHATVSRQALRQFAAQQGITPEQLLIPADGVKLAF